MIQMIHRVNRFDIDEMNGDEMASSEAPARTRKPCVAVVVEDGKVLRLRSSNEELCIMIIQTWVTRPGTVLSETQPVIDGYWTSSNT